MLEMSDSSTENNEFQFYLLLVRQYIFQLPEEDERVRAAAWMVHLRRLRDAEDLKLRNDYIKLLLFAMHSRCLIGPFAQPPQKDKGLEHFPQNFTFPDMMRHLIEESNAQSMRYCQSEHEDLSPYASEKCRVKVKVQENSEDNVSLPKVLLTKTHTCRHNIDDNSRHTASKESFIAETTASWLSELTSVSSTFSPDLKMEDLTKIQDENRKECQSTIEDAAIKIEESMKSAVNAYQEPTPLQERISLKSNPSTCGKNRGHNQEICNSELHENNRIMRNSSQFTDTLKSNIQDDVNMAHNMDEKNINNETYNPFKYSDHSRYQHCHHHHHHKLPICHSNGEKTSDLHMGITGRKCIGQMSPQMPVNGGMMTHTKQDFSVNCGHSCFSTDFRETRRKQENNSCQLTENVHNNLRTNPLLLNFQTDYDRYTTTPCNRQARENCRCSHTMSTITENTYSCPLEFNNRKCNAKYRSSADTQERGSPSYEVMQKNKVNQSYITNKSGSENGVNATENSEQHRSVTYGSRSVHALNMKNCGHERDPETMTEEQLFPTSELELPFHAANELGTNEASVRQRKSSQDVYLQGSSKQIFHTQTETQENMNSNRRHPRSTEGILTDIIPKPKSSEFNVATFRASLSADLGAYSTGYAAGYSAGYAAGIAAALHS